MSFIDEASIELIAGKGGNGCLSFRRENLFLRAVLMEETEAAEGVLFSKQKNH